jgi:Anti-sigma-K factor rskA
MTLSHRRRRGQRRIALLAAAVALLAIVFIAGYTAGNHGDSLAGSRTLKLAGTSAAPGALASLVIQNSDTAGNWPMELSVTGLPRLPEHGYYEVYLTRGGKPFAPCGVFIVKGKGGAVSVRLNAPYQLRRGDSWVVTKQLPGEHDFGTVVLHPLT